METMIKHTNTPFLAEAACAAAMAPALAWVVSQRSTDEARALAERYAT
jgi:hypothetical protein